MTKEINASILRRYNLITGVFHSAQMLVVLALGQAIFALTLLSWALSGHVL